jgi:anthranilate/para-aminobenzoate synthase component I
LGGEVNTNIAIRTCYQEGNSLHYHTGAGITADSDPSAEWEETLAKAKVFLSL